MPNTYGCNHACRTKALTVDPRHYRCLWVFAAVPFGYLSFLTFTIQGQQWDYYTKESVQAEIQLARYNYDNEKGGLFEVR